MVQKTDSNRNIGAQSDMSEDITSYLIRKNLNQVYSLKTHPLRCNFFFYFALQAYSDVEANVLNSAQDAGVLFRTKDRLAPAKNLDGCAAFPSKLPRRTQRRCFTHFVCMLDETERLWNASWQYC